MAVLVPSVAVREPLSVAWSDIVEEALAEARATVHMSGPVSCTPLSGWGAYPGHVEPQVVRFGPIVFMNGVLRNNTGAAVTLPLLNLLIIPSGYRPRPVGSAEPLNGTHLWVNMMSNASQGTYRMDVGVGGNVNVGTTSGAVTSIGVSGYIAVQGAWFCE